MNLSLLHRCEFATPRKYSGTGEIAVATIACLLWFVAIIIRLDFSNKVWTLTEKLVEASSFVVFAGVPVFFLATVRGSKFAEKFLMPHQGIGFQTLTCSLFALYITIGKWLNLSLDRFTALRHLDSLIFKQQFWLNTALFLVGLFIVLRIPFLLLQLRNSAINQQASSIKSQLLGFLTGNLIYISVVNTGVALGQSRLSRSNYAIGLVYIGLAAIVASLVKRPSAKQRILIDVCLFSACFLSLFWLSRPQFSFGLFIGVDLFILVLIYGTGLGREHFGYSFQIRKQDLIYVAKAIGLAIALLVPSALLLKFGTVPAASDQSADGLQKSLLFVFSYLILFCFRVGIFEEIVFRAGLMVFIRDWLQTRSDRSPQKLVFVSVLICSVIFGLCHLGNTPATSLLSPLEYKAIYVVLATIASLIYSLAFAETNRLWSAIVVHGVVDTTAVILLGASLRVPF